MKHSILILFLALSLSGCGFNFSDVLSVFNFGPQDDTLIDASSESQQARSLMERGKYEDARTALRSLSNSATDPMVVAGALLEIARSYELEKNWMEASLEYEQFISRYPDHPRADQAIENLIITLLKQSERVDVDITPARKAYSATFMFLENYSYSTRKDSVLQLQRDALDVIANHEIYVLDFYLRTNRTLPAQKRLKAALDVYPELAQNTKIETIKNRIEVLQEKGEISDTW